MTSKSKSLIIYEGPSVYDGAPIVAIATFKSKNRKTGVMVQTWIMRADVEPHDAQRDGDDASVCGACPLRPLAVKLAKLEGEKRAQCYVVVIQAPLSVYRAYKRGSYEYATPEQMRALLQGGMARLGAYGDPASVPFHVWQRMGVGSGEFGHTGYTHGWLRPASFDKRILGITMLSVDPVSERDDASLLPSGARSFRVLGPNETPRAGEIECPASRGVQCADCGLCAGTNKQAKNIVIKAHGGSTPIAARG
jgi:hypothetical protein